MKAYLTKLIRKQVMTYDLFVNKPLASLVHLTLVMWTHITALLLIPVALLNNSAADETDAIVLYYYGLEESERGLRECGERQACGALLQRYWRAPALIRLCRCARRRECDSPAPHARRLEINNRAHLQFCKPITDWPVCSIHDAPLTVESSYKRMNPDELEEVHHKDISLTPPKINLTCRCHNPYYWKLVDTTDDGKVHRYKCASLPLCKSGDFCGNVNYDLNSLYQSCLCPRKHICVHNGGITHIQISELLYTGKGWRAYCQPISDDYSYEDY